MDERKATVRPPGKIHRHVYLLKDANAAGVQGSLSSMISNEAAETKRLLARFVAFTGILPNALFGVAQQSNVGILALSASEDGGPVQRAGRTLRPAAGFRMSRIWRRRRAVITRFRCLRWRDYGVGCGW